MDPLISACGVPGHAVLIDCRSLVTRAVPLPTDAHILVIDSRVRRALAVSRYNLRRQQCASAARRFGVTALRDLDAVQLKAHAAGPDDMLVKRARHVVTENQRTLDAAEALGSGDLASLGRLMADSHASMRDDFEITTPAIDRLVALATDALRGEGGARMTGGGFGGCVVVVSRAAALLRVQAAVAEHYRSPQGLAAICRVMQATGGAGRLNMPW